ncbi:MAG: hypothetical protein AAGE52_02610 [Myxococcota bacterium]
MRTFVVFAVLLVSTAAAADCPSGSRSIELPPSPEDRNVFALVTVLFFGDSCVRQGDRATHVHPGQHHAFVVEPSATHMARIVVDGEVLHVSLPPETYVTFSFGCDGFRVTGSDFDVVDGRGNRPAAPTEITVTGGPGRRSCGEELELPSRLQNCRFVPQAGRCEPRRISLRGVTHSFWPRVGEHWTLDHAALRRGRIQIARDESHYRVALAPPG